MFGATIVAGPVLAARETGRAVATQGSAVLQRAASLMPLETDDALYPRDLMQTGVQSYAEFSLNEATQINPRPDTAFEIDSFVAAIGRQITIGDAMAFDRPDDLPKIDVTLRTAFGLIGLCGTRFLGGQFCGASSWGASDDTGAAALLGSFFAAESLIADRHHAVDWFRQALKDKGISPCISGQKISWQDRPIQQAARQTAEPDRHPVRSPEGLAPHSDPL